MAHVWEPTNKEVDINDLASAISEALEGIKFEAVVLAAEHDYSELEKVMQEEQK